MPEKNYISHSDEDCTGVRTNRKIKDGIGGSVGSMTDTVKQYKKSKNKCNKEVKAINKQNKMLYSSTKKYISRREIKKIKNIRAKYSKKGSNSSSDDLESKLLASQR